jgi:single-stranded DNA-binding protein
MSVQVIPQNSVQNLVLTIMSDIETKQSKKGNPFYKFRAQMSKKLEDGTWVNQTFFVTSFGDAAPRFQKKDRVSIDGRISVNGYADRVTGEVKTILELVANSINEYVYTGNQNEAGLLPLTPINDNGGFSDDVPF